MKVKTAILTGNALRWAVFVANDMTLVMRQQVEWPDDACWLIYSDGTIKNATEELSSSWRRAYSYEVWAPDEDDYQAGPILDEYRICTVWDGSTWIGSILNPGGSHWPSWNHMQTGSTRLIAAMRAFVSLKFGPEVDLPDGIACT